LATVIEHTVGTFKPSTLPSGQGERRDQEFAGTTRNGLPDEQQEKTAAPVGHSEPYRNSISQRAHIAYKQHRQAVCELNKENGTNDADVTDDAAYQHLKETGVGNLPNCDTWKRYVREARSALGRQKKKTRPKYDGRSAVPPEHFGERDDG
jgi:hypothetical protein